MKINVPTNNNQYTSHNQVIHITANFNDWRGNHEEVYRQLKATAIYQNHIHETIEIIKSVLASVVWLLVTWKI